MAGPARWRYRTWAQAANARGGTRRFPGALVGWIFAPVWTTLYVMIAIAGWRVWRRGRNTAPMKLWWAQLALNFAWSPIFFSAHRIDIALGIIALLLIAIIGFIFTAWRQDKIASLLFAPYAAWVAFASVLNGAIWQLN